MITQIHQVLATYWRRTISKPFAFVAVIIPVIGIALAGFHLLTGEVKGVSFEKEQTAMTLTWIGMLGFYCPILIAIHFKQQVIQIHQRRIASAVMAHVIVVVGLLALCSVVLPTALMAIGIWSWGVLGFTVALSAVTFLVFALQGWFALLAFPLVLVGLAAGIPSVQKWLQELCLGRHEAFGLLLLAAGIVGIAATLARLLQMTEESTGYWNIYDFDLSDINAFYKASYSIKNFPQCQPSTDDAHARGWLWKTLGWKLTPPEWQVQMWPQWARGSLWQRVRLRCVGCSDTYPLWPFAVFFSLLFSSMYITSPGRPSYTMMLNALFMTFDPVFTVTSTMPQRRKFAAMELLRPVGRSQYIMELALSYAYRVPAAWILFSIAWCLPAYVFGDSPILGRQMVNLLVLTAAFQLLFFGLTVWVMRYAVPFFTWTAICIGFYVVMIMVVTALTSLVDWHTASLDALLWASPAIVAAGALITWDAYRRWMKTDLG